MMRLITILAWAVILAGCSAPPAEIERAKREVAADVSRVEALLPFGNPSGADVSDPDNYLLIKRSYAVSYSDTKGTPNWAAWRTTINDLGKAVSRPQFEPDRQLPPGFKWILPTDYSGSGFDRGHLVPSADRFGDAASNQETFQMTNIIPQAKGLNQYTWEKLERFARGIVRRGSDVYIMAGVYGEKRRLRSRITVPAGCWKIIVVLPRGSIEIGSETQVIAVDMPNEDRTAKERWQAYLTNIRAIEAKTGYNFLSSLPQDLQDILETRVHRRISSENKNDRDQMP